VAGRTPAEAVTNFLEPFQRALSCVTDEIPTVSGGYHPSSAPHALTIGRGSPVSLIGAALRLSVLHNYRVVEDPTRGPWKVQTTAYYYSLDNDEGTEIIAYHWHPQEQFRLATPHLHLSAGAEVGRDALASAHLPTGRVALEEVLRLAIVDLGAKPNREDWAAVLESTQSAYVQWRTWG